MEATVQTLKKTSHLARNIILSAAGVLLTAVIIVGIVFINPIITLFGGNGKVNFKSMKTTASICEKSPGIYEITKSEQKLLTYRVKSGLGSVTVACNDDSDVSEVIIIVDISKITATTTSGVISQVTALVSPVLSFVDSTTIAAHALQESSKISEITTESQFKITRKIGDYNVISTKEPGSNLVITSFTK